MANNTRNKDSREWKKHRTNEDLVQKINGNILEVD